jgi:hypothetical protein
LQTVVTTESETSAYPLLDVYFQDLAAYVSANTIATSPTTVTFRDTAADTGLALSFAAGATGWQTNSTPITLLASALANHKITTPNTSGSITFHTLALIATTVAPAGGRTTKNTRAFPLGMEIGMNRLGGLAA